MALKAKCRLPRRLKWFQKPVTGIYLPYQPDGGPWVRRPVAHFLQFPAGSVESMDISETQSDGKPVLKRPEGAGVRTSFAGESSSDGASIPAPAAAPFADSIPGPNATIVDAGSRHIDPDATLVDVRLKIDPEATLVDSDATLAPGTSVRRNSLPRSPLPPNRNSDARGSAAELQTGDLLCDRYELLKLLGEGGMGAVYKARILSWSERLRSS